MSLRSRRRKRALQEIGRQGVVPVVVVDDPCAMKNGDGCCSGATNVVD